MSLHPCLNLVLLWLSPGCRTDTEALPTPRAGMGVSLGQLINNHSLILISVFPGHSPAWPDPALVLDMFKNEAQSWRKQGQSSRGSWEGRSEGCLSEAGVRWIFRGWFSALAFSSCSFLSLSSVLKSDPHNLFSRVFPLWSQFSANYRFFNPVKNATVTKVFEKLNSPWPISRRFRQPFPQVSFISHDWDYPSSLKNTELLIPSIGPSYSS